MADILLRAQQAAMLWLSSITAALSYCADFEQHTASTCGHPNTTVGNEAAPAYIISAPTATLIGTDSAGIGYFHLTGFTARAWSSQYLPLWVTSGCDPNGTTFTNAYRGVTSGVAPGALTQAIIDGGSTPHPHSGLDVFHHSGYPVVAATIAYVSGGNNNWVAFAGGDATALTVAAAKTACGITSESFASCNDISMTIVV